MPHNSERKIQNREKTLSLSSGPTLLQDDVKLLLWQAEQCALSALGVKMSEPSSIANKCNMGTDPFVRSLYEHNVYTVVHYFLVALYQPLPTESLEDRHNFYQIL